MYNKLFGKIVDSSIWLAPDPVRIVWITFLAVMDEDGFVQLPTVANVSHRARIALADAEEAVRVLESPEPSTANEEDDGRRIERVPGGWIVLNAKKYRDMATREIQRASTRARVQRHRDRKRAEAAGNGGVTQEKRSVMQSEAEAYTEAEKNTPVASLPTSVEQGSTILSQQIERVFDHWRKTWQHPRAALDEKRRKVIRNALKSYTEADLCQAITGYLNSPHHCGQNDRSTVYDDIGLFMRDSSHIDAGLKFYAAAPHTGFSSLTKRNIEATKGWKPPELRGNQDAGA